MKFIDLEDNLESTPSLPRVIKAAAPAKQSRRGGLAARWDIVDGKLVCRWIVE